MRKFVNQVKQTAQQVNEGVRFAFRGILNVVKSAGDIQKVQVSALADETLQDVELMQHFGLTSVPPAGTEAVILPIGGRTTHGIVIATEHGAFRVKGLKSGEVAIYDQSGSTIILKSGKVVEINCDKLIINASQKIELKTPLVETSQALTVQGRISGQGGMHVQGGEGANFSGNVVQQDGSFSTTGDIRAGNVSLKEHTHHQDGRGKPKP